MVDKIKLYMPRAYEERYDDDGNELPLPQATTLIEAQLRGVDVADSEEKLTVIAERLRHTIRMRNALEETVLVCPVHGELPPNYRQVDLPPIGDKKVCWTCFNDFMLSVVPELSSVTVRIDRKVHYYKGGTGDSTPVVEESEKIP